MTFVEANVLKVSDRIVTEKNYDSVIDYLTEHYPDGFGEKNCTISVNGIDIQIENYDVKLADDAVVVLMFHPAVTIVGYPVLTFIANLLISTAVSYVIGRIFAPSMPNLQTSLSSRNSAGQASSVYSLNSQQNEAKIGAVIPIIYGRVRTYPALICSPYYRFEDNVEYLYQLMCIGQGKFNIDKMMISDTNVNTIQGDYFRYETLEYDDFKTVQGIKDKVNAPNYYGLVKTIPDIDNLELRGTPENTEMVMRFENSTITFYPYADGSEPDLSSLINGSKITISNTLHNDGDYVVDFVTGLVVTVQAHTFVTEPDNNIYTAPTGINRVDTRNSTMYEFESPSVATTPVWYANLRVGHNVHYTSPNEDFIDFIKSIQLTISEDWKVWKITFENHTFVEIYDAGDITITIESMRANAQFETSYGSFKYDKPHIGFEVDIVYPSGVYNTDDATGDFLARDTAFDLGIKNANITETRTITTSGKLDNGAIQITYKYIYADETHAAIQQNMALTFKRITEEPTGVKSNDKTFIKSVKFLLEEQNYEPLGDITLLWCKVRATNAINSIGQFAINCWVNRRDVANDVKSVVTDIYTNDVYGGRLPVIDLDLDDTSWWTYFKRDAETYVIYEEIYQDVWVYRIYYENKFIWQSSSLPATGVSFGDGYKIDSQVWQTAQVSKLIVKEVNGAIDSKMTLFDAMQMIAKSNRYTVFPVGSDIKLKHDAAKPVRTAKYNETNIIDSIAITYLFEEFAENDSVKITYRDSEEFKEVTAIYPSDGVFPLEIELWGCTSESVALAMATYLFKQDRARRKSIEFTTDVQGLIPQFLDRIGITHNLPKWGISGQISYINGNYITLTCSYDLSDGIYNNIIFRKEDGSVSNIITMVVIDSDTVEITGDIPEWLYDGEEFDKTYFSMGKSNTFVKDYIVISVVPNGDEITITATNYDETIY